MKTIEELTEEIESIKRKMENNVVAKFEKISLTQFKKDYDINPILTTEIYNQILKTPVRSSEDSAGYDFVTTKDILLSPGESTVVYTGIRASIQKGWVLLLAPRSGLGSRYRMQLNNTVGVIDGDYYHTDNEGHIIATITNDGDRELLVKTGERFMQGIFVPYGITIDDKPKGKRIGGLGSSGLE